MSPPSDLRSSIDELERILRITVEDARAAEHIPPEVSGLVVTLIEGELARARGLLDADELEAARERARAAGATLQDFRAVLRGEADLVLQVVKGGDA